MSCSHIAGNKVGHCIHSAMGSDIYAKCRDLISQKTRSMSGMGGGGAGRSFLRKEIPYCNLPHDYWFTLEAA